MSFIYIEVFLAVMLPMSFDRLKRICRYYGSNPVFICTSATIANPLELAENLTEETDGVD